MLENLERLCSCVGAVSYTHLDVYKRQAFCDPGDVVLCENPSFIGCLNAFRSYEVKLAGIEVEDDGISIEQLRKNLEAYPDAKFLYVIPNFQNPSGVTMSLQKRKAVYELCVKYGVLIIEDRCV